VVQDVVEGHRAEQVVAVVSAMGHTTDRLTALAQSVNPEPPARELADTYGTLLFAIDLDGLARETGTTITAELCLMRDAFLLKQDDPFVGVFQGTYEATAGRRLPVGAKPFCDDGNSFWALAGVPALTERTDAADDDEIVAMARKGSPGGGSVL